MTQRQFPIRFGFGIAALFALLFIPTAAVLHAQEPAPANQLLSPNQLDDLVAPIALYPDPLISQILVASTYPLEVVQANQWLLRNPNLSGVALSQAAEQQNWDPSVQALVPFSDVLKYLNEDITWTMNLGNAFLAQESDVMDAVQRMRARAAQNGKLASSAQLRVNRVYESGQPVYEILPVEPEVIYVPVYDPLWIWGPSYYYPYPRWYYAPHYPALYFNRGISISFFYGSGWSGGWYGWNSWGWSPAWRDRRVIVNNTFIYRHSPDPIRRSNVNVTTVWTHDSVHRQGVPYSTASVSERFRGGGSRDGVRTREVSAPTRSVSSSSVTTSQYSGPRTGGGGVSNSPNTDRNRSVGGGNSTVTRERSERAAPSPITSRNVQDSARLSTTRPPSSSTQDRAQFQSPAQGGGFARSQNAAPAPQRQVQQPSREIQPQRNVAPQTPPRSSQTITRQSSPVRESAPARSSGSSGPSHSNGQSQRSSSNHGRSESSNG
ncbi:MAG TPA: DUF3300 domain-containing protein, partial [Terriglobia bacterium]|nr:DUF3300 domain-containing protein [Terriglobia bacterium]